MPLVLASLYPLGTVPEIFSTDVRQPAGQYLLRGEEGRGKRKKKKNGMNAGQAKRSTNIRTKLPLFT